MLMKYALVVAALSVLATPAFADEVGADSTTVIKKEHDDGTRSKTIIKERE